MSSDESHNEDATEFVMKKRGSHLDVWAVVNGTQVFHAQPHVTAAGEIIQAAAKAWITRAWEEELNDLLQDDNQDGGLGRFFQ